jgi:hypothetical protein
MTHLTTSKNDFEKNVGTAGLLYDGGGGAVLYNRRLDILDSLTAELRHHILYSTEFVKRCKFRTKAHSAFHKWISCSPMTNDQSFSTTLL